ncbi:trypsin-like serine peptidase [Streptomyces sp. NPDC057638]|uniref:trypsin-like serine peptidase n=1 Tax=Streptomyces sp. NPDC057638 TaxID=3346190 RepID=UPI003688E826
MGSGTSPVATDTTRVFGDLHEVAQRVREGLYAEVPESEELRPDGSPLPADEEAAARVSARARQERGRVLAAGADGLEKLAEGRADEISDDESFGMEAIVLLEGRPALLVQRQDFPDQAGDWAVLNGRRAGIHDSILRVGRVEVSGHPSLDWLGTAFLVGPETVMTNRHVAVEFTRVGGAGWTFKEGMASRIATAEGGYGNGAAPGPLAPGDVVYEVTGVHGVHTDHDLALLRVAPRDDGGAPAPRPLAIAADAPPDVPGHLVYCVGYPAYDGRRNEPVAMSRIFMDVYNVKRLQPGTTTALLPEGTVLTHDCSTLGGNSGSPVFDLADHRVLGLHFGGRYGVGNYAVPLWNLVDDPLLRRAGVNFV